MRAECRLLEEACDEFVGPNTNERMIQEANAADLLDFVYVLLPKSSTTDESLSFDSLR